MLATLIPLRPESAVEFDRAPVVTHARCGMPYTRWVAHGMPKLGEYQYLLDVVFFLYPDEVSAETGTNSGGTGFFVAIPSSTYPSHYHHVYAVTNHHVACGYKSGKEGSAPCPVIRINSHNGKPKVLWHDPAEWHFRGRGPDVAVLPLDLNPSEVKVEAIETSSFFITCDLIEKFEVNAGEDAFMLGRFLDYDGIEENCPSMRFGNLSMMAAKQIQPTGYNGNSFVVDMHSRTGYSGSPVFIYRTPGSIFARPNSIMGGGHFIKLLGILWGQFPEEWEIKVKEAPKTAVPHTIPLMTGHTIKGMSGMSLVVPAWEIWETLNMPMLKKRRDEIDAGLHKVFRGVAEPQSTAPPPKDDSLSDDANPNHREDFMRLVASAGKAKKQDDRT
jgi:hypothetical protein